MSHRVMSVLLSRNPKVRRTSTAVRAAAPEAAAPEAAAPEAAAPEAAAPEAAEERLTMSNTKAELTAAAEAKGVDLPSGATKAQILEALYA